MVFPYGYRLPFHHLPPVSLDPRDLPSCSLESLQVLALQEEIDKMIQKGALEIVDQPGLGFYSCLFLVKATGGWALVIDLSALNCFVMSMKFRMETIVLVLGSIRKRDWMFLTLSTASRFSAEKKKKFFKKFYSYFNFCARKKKFKYFF